MRIAGVLAGRAATDAGSWPREFGEPTREMVEIPLACKRCREVPGGRLIAEPRQRRRGVHGGDLLVELQFASLLRQATLGDRLLQASVAVQERGRALRTHAAGARQLVRGIASQGDEVGHLVRFDTIALPHLGRTDAGKLARLHRVKDGCGGGGKLKCIAIAAGDEYGAVTTFLAGCGRGEEIVSLVARSLGIGEAARLDEPRQHLQLVDQFRIELATGLVLREQPLPICRRAECVPADQHRARLLGLDTGAAGSWRSRRSRRRLGCRCAGWISAARGTRDAQTNRRPQRARVFSWLGDLHRWRSIRHSLSRHSQSRHSRESGNPGEAVRPCPWVPAFARACAGMTRTRE